MAGAVSLLAQYLIDQAMPSAKDLGNATGTLGGDKVAPTQQIDGQTFASIDDALIYLASKAGSGGTPSTDAPAPSGVPSVSDTTLDAGQSFNFVPVTSYTGTQPSGSPSKIWQLVVGGVPILTSTTIATTAPLGVEGLFYIPREIAFWAGAPVQTDGVQRQFNAAALPKPQAITRPTFTISAGAATGAHGLYDLAVSDYQPHWVDGNGTTIGTGTTLATAAFSGLAIRFAETPIGVNGAGPVAFSDPQTIPTGVVPTYVGGVEPGFVPQSVFRRGTPIDIDPGVPVGNWIDATYQFYRGGLSNPIIGGGGTNVTTYSYTPISADIGQMLSATFKVRNSAGSSETVTIPAVLIADVITGGASGGGTGEAVFVNASSFSADAGATADNADITVPAGALPGHIAILAISVNDNALTINTPTGWTIVQSQQANTAIGEKTAVFWKVLAQGETSVHCAWSGVNQYVLGMTVYSGGTGVSISAAPFLNTTLTASPLTCPFPAVTTTASNKTICLIGVLDPDNAPTSTTWTPPSGYTERLKMDFDGAVSSGMLWMADGVKATAGSTGTLNATATVAGLSSGAGRTLFTLVIDS